MRSEKDISEWIEAYVTNRLSDLERKNFETRLQTDPELQGAVEREQLLHRFLLEKELYDIRQTMAGEIQKIERRATLQKYVAIAAVILLAAGAAYFYVNSLTNKSLSRISKVQIPGESQKNIKREPIGEELDEHVTDPSTDGTVPHSEHEKGENERKYSPLKEQQLLMDTSNKNPLGLEIGKEAENSSKLFSKEDSAFSPGKDPCGNGQLKASFTTKASQKNQKTGVIQIKLYNYVSGSVLYALDPGGEFVKEPYFEHLASDKYSVYAKEESNCVYLLGVTYVRETWCVDEYPKTYSPNYDAPWILPIGEGEATSVIIKDKTGSIVFDWAAPFAAETTWTGATKTGGQAATGLYKVFINYQNGETCVASVTLFQ